LFTFREAGTQVSPVTISRPSLRTAASPCLPLGIKDSPREDKAFCLRLLLLAFGFLMWEALEGKRIAEGKGMAEGELLKGKELLKGNC
jgi:hypothetical protein